MRLFKVSLFLVYISVLFNCASVPYVQSEAINKNHSTVDIVKAAQQALTDNRWIAKTIDAESGYLYGEREMQNFNLATGTTFPIYKITINIISSEDGQNQITVRVVPPHGYIMEGENTPQAETEKVLDSISEILGE